MGSVTVTFDFAADEMGFQATPKSSNTVMTYDSGSLKSRISGKNVSDVNNYWQKFITLEDLGLPPGSTLTAIRSPSMRSKCTEFDSGASSISGTATIVLYTNQWTLSAPRTIRSVDGDFVTSAGDEITGISLPSTTSGAITIFNSMGTTGHGGAVSLLQDSLTFTLDYI